MILLCCYLSGITKTGDIMAEFNIEVQEKEGVQIVNVLGFLDAHTAPQMEDLFTKLIEEKKYRITVNLERLNYIGSAGLGVFMAFIETLRENGGDIKFTNLSESVYSVFDLLGFPVLFEFYKEEKEAVEKYLQG